MPPEPAARPGAKVLLLAPGPSVLLFRGHDPGRPGVAPWWFPPGGGIEAGESASTAARRELQEETGLTVADVGPVVGRRHALYEFDGDRFVSDEELFAVRVDHFDIDTDGWTDVERAVMDDHRWWTVDELRATSARVYPEELAWLVEVHSGGGDGVVSVSRRIAVTPAAVFAVLASPARHRDLDGSGMVRGAVTDGVVTGEGAVFTMAMHFPALGDYEMDNHVVEFERDRLIGWEPVAGRGHPGHGQPRWGHRWSYRLLPDGPDATVVVQSYDCSRAPAAARASVDDGRAWLDAMAATLARLEALCTGQVLL